MSYNSEVQNFTWWVQEHTFSYDLKVLELGGYDVIIGMDWLEQWGEMNCHWKEKWVKFLYKGNPITLQGIQSSSLDQLQEMSLEQVMSWYKENKIWETALVEPHALVAVANTPAEISQLLDQYKDVFDTPSSLPPSRAFDHAIHLYPEAIPVNSWPYRYSPLQKEEIEKQVQEMIHLIQVGIRAKMILRASNPLDRTHKS